MFYYENSLVDIPYDKKLETDIIHCFMNDSNIVVFPWFVLDPSRFDELKKVLGDLLELNPTDIEGIPLRRELFRTKGDIFDFGLKESESVIWFSPINDEELLKVLMDAGIGYKCFILKKGSNIIDFEYKLEVYEHHEVENTEYRSLFINSTSNYKFQERVLPKLKKIIENYNRNILLRTTSYGQYKWHYN